MAEKEKESIDSLKEREAQGAPEADHRGRVIGDCSKQADWRTTQKAHMLEQDESATDLFYKPGSKQASQKFELVAEDLKPESSIVLKGGVECKEFRGPAANALDGWLEAGRRIGSLPLDKQGQVIGAALIVGMEQYHQDKRERELGAVIGAVQGIGNVAVNLAKIADFSAYCIIGDKTRAAQLGEEFGVAIGQTIVSGVRLFEAVWKYSYDIGYSGDYGKPVKDLLTVGQLLNDEWNQLPSREQERRKYEILSQMVADGLIGTAGAQAIGKAKSFTEFLDVVASQSANSGVRSIAAIEKTSAKISAVVEDLLEPDLKSADALTFRRARDIPAKLVEDNAVEEEIFLSREVTPAVGKGGDWPVLNERPSGDVVRQHDLISCVAAVGEMLSNGAWKQSDLIKLVSTVPENLVEHLGPGWKGGFIPSKQRDSAFETIMRTGKSWGAELRDEFYHYIEMGHMVVVDGYDEAGNIRIRDPQHGTRYEMTKEAFFHHWSDRAIFNTL